MIVITCKRKVGDSRPVQIQGRSRDLSIDRPSVRNGKFSIAKEILSRFDRFRNVDGFLFVEPGAVIRPPLELFHRKNFDVAAYVDRAGNPSGPGTFDGIGRVSTFTLFFRQSLAARRVLDRWIERNYLHPRPEAENLLFTLSEVGGVVFFHLPPEYCWIEPLMRPFHIDAVPVIEHGVPEARPARLEPSRRVGRSSGGSGAVQAVPRPPEVLWTGHLYQYTGYGKANREILFRAANSLTIRVDDTHREPIYVHESLRVRLDAHKQILVGPRAPLLRFMGPDHVESRERHRIVWTMMETSVRVHPDMVARANRNFDELWTPTMWNLGVLKESGLKLPGRVMSLGVDPLIFRPQTRRSLPRCRLISTSRRGSYGAPCGFVALTIGLPGFRKGWDVIADAFERVFAGRKDVHLVVGLTHSPPAWTEKVYRQFAGYKANIWTLEGSFDESALAAIYAGSDAYVSASRGEGFNLPALEAAACGVPVILPHNTVHPEVFGMHAFYFHGQGQKTYPEGDWISDWYKGQLFTDFGQQSVKDLAAILETVRENGRDVRARAVAQRRRVLEKYTWDRAAAAAVERLLEVQP